MLPGGDWGSWDPWNGASPDISPARPGRRAFGRYVSSMAHPTRCPEDELEAFNPEDRARILTALAILWEEVISQDEQQAADAAA